MSITHQPFSIPMLHARQVSGLVPSGIPTLSRSVCTNPLTSHSKCRWRCPGVLLDTVHPSLQRCRYYSSELSQNRLPVNPIEEDEIVIGDCIVYEEGIFENPFLTANEQSCAEEDDDTNGLIPEDWKDLQRELNMTKKEKKKRMYMMELSNSHHKKKDLELHRDGLSDSNSIKLPNLNFLNSDFDNKLSRATENLSTEPSGEAAHEEGNAEKELTLPENNCSSDEQTAQEEDNVEKELTLRENNCSSDEKKGDSCIGDATVLDSASNKRFLPKNPRLEVAGAGFEDIAKRFNEEYRATDSGNMGSDRPEERRQLLTPEEKIILNKRVPDLQQATSEKWMPLHTLATAGQSYLLNLLLTHNVDINAVDKDGLTALHKAISCKKQGIVNFLLKAGADASIRDRDGATLMHYAVEVAAVQTIKLLILYGVDIDLTDYYGWTPLHLAVQSRRTDVVRLLLIKGADKRIRNKDGNTPLDLCLYSGRDLRTYELIKLLKQLPRIRLQNDSPMQIWKKERMY